MSRALRLPSMPLVPPLVLAPLTAISFVLLLGGGIPVVAFPYASADAATYRQAIVDPAHQCAGNPVPAANGCWSAAGARVTITGVDHLDSGDVAFLVVQPNGGDAVRENLVEGERTTGIDVGNTVTVRYWHADIAEVLPPAAAGIPQAVLATRDNPLYRTAHFPTGSAVTAVLGSLGLLGFGVPLGFAVRRWRRRRRIEAEADAAAREATSRPDFGRGLARYGMSFAPATPAPAPTPAPEATLTGQRAWSAPEAETPPAAEPEAPAQAAPAAATVEPPPAEPAELPPGLRPGGAGWNIRER